MYVLYLVIVLSVVAPPTNPSAEMVSPTTILVSWEPPSDGPTVTGYILTQSYTDQHEKIITLPSYITRFTQITTNCEERLNITLQAVSQHLSSIPVPIEFVLRKLDSVYCIELHMCMQTSSYCCNYRIADILLVCVLCMCNIILLQSVLIAIIWTNVLRFFTPKFPQFPTPLLSSTGVSHYTSSGF